MHSADEGTRAAAAVGIFRLVHQHIAVRLSFTIGSPLHRRAWPLAYAGVRRRCCRASIVLCAHASSTPSSPPAQYSEDLSAGTAPVRQRAACRVTRHRAVAPIRVPDGPCVADLPLGVHASYRARVARFCVGLPGTMRRRMGCGSRRAHRLAHELKLGRCTRADGHGGSRERHDAYGSGSSGCCGHRTDSELGLALAATAVGTYFMCSPTARAECRRCRDGGGGGDVGIGDCRGEPRQRGRCGICRSV